MAITREFKDWGLGYSGCDGGDLGSPNTPSIWVCGIEWGGGHGVDGLTRELGEDRSEAPQGYDDWEHNLAYPFNRNVLKILAAIEGQNVDEYAKFAETVKPFTAGSSGYFKMNLYPIGFKNTDPAHWVDEFAGLTGFESKDQYVEWCREERFPQIRNWARSAKPKLVLGLGKTYLDDFKTAFLDPDTTMTVENAGQEEEIHWGKNSEGTLLVVTRFPMNSHGLVSNEAIGKVGARISALVGSKQD